MLRPPPPPPLTFTRNQRAWLVSLKSCGLYSLELGLFIHLNWILAFACVCSLHKDLFIWVLKGCLLLSTCGTKEGAGGRPQRSTPVTGLRGAPARGSVPRGIPRLGARGKGSILPRTVACKLQEVGSPTPPPPPTATYGQAESWMSLGLGWLVVPRSTSVKKNALRFVFVLF